MAKLLDAGGQILISSGDRVDVEATLSRLTRRGSRVISPISQVGSNWVATCTQPPPSASVDDTTTSLKLADLKAAMAKKSLAEQHGCTITELGFTQIIAGPSPESLQAVIQEMVDSGATLQRDPEQMEDTWQAILDVSSMRGAGYRWQAPTDE